MVNAKKDYGYKGLMMDAEMAQAIDEIKKTEMCKSRAEVVRRLIVMYRRNAKFLRYYLYFGGFSDFSNRGYLKNKEVSIVEVGNYGTTVHAAQYPVLFSSESVGAAAT